MSIVIADANYLCHAAQHSKTGELRNGVIYGALRMLMAEAKKADMVVLASDWGGLDTLKRKQLGTEASRIYKENRRDRRKAPFAEDDEDLQMEAEALKADFNRQRNTFKLICESIGIACYHAPGYEADDVIAWLIRDHFKDRVEIRIISNDSDLYQLFNDRQDITMCRPTRDSITEFTYDDFKAKYQTWAERWPMIKAIAGDSTDNIVGLEGIGIKTAVKMVRGTGNSRQMDLLITHQARIKENLELTVLPFDDKIVYALQSTGGNGLWAHLDRQAWKVALMQHEMPSLKGVLD